MIFFTTKLIQLSSCISIDGSMLSFLTFSFILDPFLTKIFYSKSIFRLIKDTMCIYPNSSSLLGNSVSLLPWIGRHCPTVTYNGQVALMPPAISRLALVHVHVISHGNSGRFGLFPMKTSPAWELINIFNFVNIWPFILI